MSSRGPGHRSRSRGVSLIEAIVALAVMGFGMLGIAAMQSSLRQNSDTARQRAEATRLASEAIEAMRSYSVVNTASGKIAYADLVTGVAAPQLALPSTITGTNATYTRTVEVSEASAQNRKTVFVKISWADRSGQPQELVLSTEIQRSPPELAASLIVPASGTATQLPRGRHPTIPQAAIDNGDGTSSFTPPGPGSGPVWKFNNTTGVIEDLCSPSPCPTTARLLAGFIGFSLPSAPLNSEHPPSDVPAGFSSKVKIEINPLTPAPPAPTPPALTPPLCYLEEIPPKVLAYYCAIPVGTSTTPNYVWSGRSYLAPISPPPSPPPLDLSGGSPTGYQVCRYTTVPGIPLVGSGTPPLRNEDHPDQYKDVRTNLVNQNFLVIGGGVSCPGDDPSTPLINGLTTEHSP